MISRRSMNQESLRSIDVKLPLGTDLLNVNEKEVPEYVNAYTSHKRTEPHPEKRPQGQPHD